MTNLNLEELSVEQLARLISPASEAHQELRARGVLRTKNVVGELGEYYAEDIYNKTPGLPNLTLADPGVQNVDALSRNGEIYSIKTVTSRKGTTGSFWNPEAIESNNQSFHYLLIVILEDSYAVDMVLELTWDDFMEHKKFNKRMNNYNISVTNKLIESVKCVYRKE